jgi:uncharacterized protein (DUF4415 family)
MAKDDTKHYSRSELAAMKAKGEVRPTSANAPEIDLDKAFWDKAKIVETRPRRKASVHLRLDPATLAFYRSAGRGPSHPYGEHSESLRRDKGTIEAIRRSQARRERVCAGIGETHEPFCNRHSDRGT